MEYDFAVDELHLFVLFHDFVKVLASGFFEVEGRVEPIHKQVRIGPLQYLVEQGSGHRQG
jgi:hypothetical protein